MDLSLLISLTPFVVIGFFPSLVWLLFYLKKDVNPEPSRMVIKIFFYGILVTLPLFLVGIFLEEKALIFPVTSFFSLFLYYFIIIGLVEEILKYIPFKFGVSKKPELDEPVDVILYMIIAGLGFAAAENILFFVQEAPDFLMVTRLAALRLFTATFLHTLASGIFGYFIALSFWRIKYRKFLFFSGLILATVLHGFYNLFIIEYDNYLRVIIPLTILVVMGLFISFIAFPHLKKIKSICLLQKKR